MNEYTNFFAMISTEFHRYLMENEEFAEKIPTKGENLGTSIKL